MKTWLRHHLRAARDTVAGFARAPLSTFLGVAVIGVTLALPAGLYTAIENLDRLAGGWEGPARISLFLKASVTVADAGRLGARLQRNTRVARVELITPDQGLAEFRRYSGFDSAIEALGHNPLPAVLVVRPAQDHQKPDAVAALKREFAALPETDRVIVDLEWVERLQAWLAIADRVVWLLSVLLAAAVLLITGNTIRLAVLNRRDEIAVVQLLGGTDAFIRRPFLYAGALQGLLGGLAAFGLLALATFLLEAPVGDLAGLYRSEFALTGVGLEEGLILSGAGAGLGLLGSWLAVAGWLKAGEHS